MRRHGRRISKTAFAPLFRRRGYFARKERRQTNSGVHHRVTRSLRGRRDDDDSDRRIINCLRYYRPQDWSVRERRQTDYSTFMNATHKVTTACSRSVDLVVALTYRQINVGYYLGCIN